MLVTRWVDTPDVICHVKLGRDSMHECMRLSAFLRGKLRSLLCFLGPLTREGAGDSYSLLLLHYTSLYMKSLDAFILTQKVNWNLCSSLVKAYQKRVHFFLNFLPEKDEGQLKLLKRMTMATVVVMASE